MALVVIEGVDRTGKSTLAEALSEEYKRLRRGDTRVLHFGAPDGLSAMDEYLPPLLEYRPYSYGTNLIFDRAHVGEAVWPKLFGRQPKLTSDQYCLLHLVVVALGGMYVFTTRDRQDLYKAFQEADPPEPLDPSLIPAAQGLFDEQRRHLAAHGASVWQLDVGEEGFEDSVRELANRALDLEEAAEEKKIYRALPSGFTPGLLPFAGASA